jgi:hypothetical protein
MLIVVYGRDVELAAAMDAKGPVQAAQDVVPIPGRHPDQDRLLMLGVAGGVDIMNVALSDRATGSIGVTRPPASPIVR